MYENLCQCDWCLHHRRLMENGTETMISKGEWRDKDARAHKFAYEYCIPNGYLSADYLLVDGGWK